MPKVLVVDDATFMRMKATKLLSSKGYEVVEAATGAEAVESYKAESPDAVLLDITMPDMDGLQALKERTVEDQGDHHPAAGRLFGVSQPGEQGERAIGGEMPELVGNPRLR